MSLVYAPMVSLFSFSFLSIIFDSITWLVEVVTGKDLYYLLCFIFLLVDLHFMALNKQDQHEYLFYQVLTITAQQWKGVKTIAILSNHDESYVKFILILSVVLVNN
jgi:hypothetical protein